MLSEREIQSIRAIQSEIKKYGGVKQGKIVEIIKANSLSKVEADRVLNQVGLTCPPLKSYVFAHISPTTYKTSP